ncbi:glutamate cyclase domain-containing protein [Thermococcus zilligii]|uniref:glutamate cyclase domain-containing protein n=1 Tax=Thermococcus zilligii TaxID=54076 RepID=UPI000299F02B|nr:glutamate cyclase domain-containing protein [Thermococcus zilligii]
MIAHIINTDAGGRGIGRVYLEYRLSSFNFMEKATETFLDNLDKTLVITGFPIPPSMVPETDGPPGALALVRAVEDLGGSAEVLSYPEVLEAIKGFGVSVAGDVEVSNYSLIIAIETPGRASDGKYYSMSGTEIIRGAFDGIFLEAREYGIPTIAIGDGGNEAGMGNIRGLIERYIPLGRKIASVVGADHLITSGVSNWGAYGLVAQASLMAGRNLLLDWDERKVLTALKAGGIIDGVRKRACLSVDGIGLEVHEKIVELLKTVVNDALGD